MQWVWAFFGWGRAEERPPDDRERFARREADLQRRFERLDHEVEVAQRVQPNQEPRE